MTCASMLGYVYTLTEQVSTLTEDLINELTDAVDILHSAISCMQANDPTAIWVLIELAAHITRVIPD